MSKQLMDKQVEVIYNCNKTQIYIYNNLSCSLPQRGMLRPRGSSLSDWRLMGECLELVGGRLLDTPPNFRLFNLPSRVSARRFIGPGFKVARMLARPK